MHESFQNKKKICESFYKAVTTLRSTVLRQWVVQGNVTKSKSQHVLQNHSGKGEMEDKVV